MFPDVTFHGRTEFEWLEEGAFLLVAVRDRRSR
jgi:hypothetical protein